MIAPRSIPNEYLEWNRHWGAPYGRSGPIRRRSSRLLPRLRGPFGFQTNNSTRFYEYPWVFHALGNHQRARLLDVGGSLAGLQFVLSRCGAQVVNVDPGNATSSGFPEVDADRIDRLNTMFHTDVRLVRSPMHVANLADESFDAVYSVSTIEHIPLQHLELTMQEIARVLRPGGRCVLTVDLFLNLEPFSARASNEFGHNVAPRLLKENAGLELANGNQSELYGFAEFDPRRILGSLENYLIGDQYPALAQCFVLQKPAG